MNAQKHTLSLLLAAFGLLVACERKADDGTAKADPKSAAAEAKQPSAAAGAGASEALAANAPATPAATAAPACAEAPNGKEDLLGIAVGDDQQTARERLICANPHFQIEQETADYRLDGVLLSRVNLVADTGLDQVSITLAGAPGRERVIGVSRRIEFTDEKRPAVEALRTSFAAKYGELDYWSEVTQVREGQKYVTKLIEDKNLPRVIWSVDGQRLYRSAKAYHNCVYAVSGVADSRTSFPSTPRGCGFGFTAQIKPLAENPLLVGEVVMRITNVAGARNLLAQEALAAKNEASQQLAAERARDAEAAKAAGASGVPKL